MDDKISCGTVCRNLGRLTADGQICHVRVPGTDRYDSRTDMHNHLNCMQCGTAVDTPFRLPDKDRYNRCRDDRPSNQPASDHCGRPLFEMPERMRKRMVDKEMINGENGKMLRNDPYEIRLMQNLYDAAVKQLSLKFEILNNEFKVLYARNPIHHIEGRVKAIESMVAKLRKKGLPPTIEAARESINDIAGVRVVCSYIDDVYRVAEMVERQTDIEIIKRQDYIRTPNYNGYRSLHLDIRMPVYLSDRTEHVTAEIQIRTIAMDFWASLEHDVRYKVDKTKLPEGINEEMLACSDKIAEIDRQMQDMYRRIKAAGTNTVSPSMGEPKKQDRE